LSFKTHSADEGCGSSSNITLNGIYLPQEWSGNFASGTGSFSSVPDLEENAWFSQHDLDLEWESACLLAQEPTVESADDQPPQHRADDAVQVLRVTIKSIDGKVLESPSGFTISFNQAASPPELLRFEPTPNRSIITKTDTEEWRAPPPHLRLSLQTFHKGPHDLENFPVLASHKDTPASLEDDLRALETLQAQIKHLQKAIAEKQNQIHSQFNQEAQHVKQELKDCDSLRCVAKVLGDKTRGAWRVLYIRIRPGRQQHSYGTDRTGNKMGRPDEPYAQVWRASAHHEHTIKIESLSSEKHDTSEEQSDRSPSTSDEGAESYPLPPYSEHASSSRSTHLAILQIAIGILCCGCLVSAIRHSCCSQRTKADRAASNEERRTQQQYRRAARRHAWSQWWRQRRNRTWVDQARIDDYEEKRGLISSQESLLEDVMQEEIRQLRNAHGIVNDLVRAEEGRILSAAPPTHPLTCQNQNEREHDMYGTTPPSPTSSTYTSNSLVDLPSRPLSRTSSLPGYHSDASTAPPAYESDEDVSERVANGFQYQPYTPLSAGSSGPESVSAASTGASSVERRWTPDSSVVDVSPRPSAETLRYAESMGTNLGDCESEGEED
jgi:hypothetical protein